MHEKLFFFQKLSKLLETKLFKGDIFVFSLFNKACKPTFNKKQSQKLQNYENLTHKQIKGEITLSKPNKEKAHKDDSRMFYLIKIKSRTS